ncbi:MAG: carbohydrate kinase family protein [Solibacillus sp.]
MREGIAVAGTIAYDEIKQIERFPSKSELALIRNVQQSIGGAVSNCAVTLAKIDNTFQIEVIALIGDDGRGQFLHENLSRYENINLNQLKVIGETTFTDVIHDMTDHSRTFFAYQGNANLFDEHTIDFSKVNAKILHIAYILLLDGLDQPDVEYGTKMAKVLKKAQDEGIQTSIDIVSENSNRYEKLVPPCLKYVNYCVINEIEAGKSVGILLRDENNRLIKQNIKPVLYKLKQLGVKDWVIIHTPEGSFGYDGNQVYSLPSLVIDHTSIKGTVGAGDAYVSGVLYGAHNGLSIIESMQIGTASAATSLFEADSTSGVKSYTELIEVYEKYSKRATIEV